MVLTYGLTAAVSDFALVVGAKRTNGIPMHGVKMRTKFLVMCAMSVALPLGATGCFRGKESTVTLPNKPNTEDLTKASPNHDGKLTTYDSLVDVPECQSEIKGQMVFVEGIKQIQICDGRFWQAVKGEQGAPGTPGQDGSNGADGAAGVAGQDGADGRDGKSGKDGQDGEDGQNGQDASRLTATWQDVTTKVEQSVVQIISVYCPNQDLTSGECEGSLGTGFIVGQDVIATNGHVLDTSMVSIDPFYADLGMYVPLALLPLTQVSVAFPNDQGSTYCTYDGEITCDPGIELVTATAIDLRQAHMYSYRPNMSGIFDPNVLEEDAQFIEDRIQDESQDHDIALLRVPTGNRQALALSERVSPPHNKDLAIGVGLQEELLYVGYPGGGDHLFVTTGNVVAIQPATHSGMDVNLEKVFDEDGAPTGTFTLDGGFVDRGDVVIAVDLASGSGASGGPVFDAQGQVVALLFAGGAIGSGSQLHYLTQVSHLRQLLDLVKTEAENNNSQWRRLP